jgi:hypothetical protein
VEKTPPRRRPAPKAPQAGPSFSDLKTRQLVFLLTRQLAEAQFARADEARAHALWQEAAALELDPDRVINLLYGVADHADSEEMSRVDERHLQSQIPHRRGWWTPKWGPLTRKESGVWHRSAPPAGSPSRP